ncbi:hypothetical protein OBBRIDRAFT_803717 [Obba rivulosa]|uniref:Uncharacterized protein n=1 Tax=Obba rivulosa TaxID=1052685 RepID=A0A8E2AZ96_9APHY|nr:hypothetical protein OBBRIDRAFT_803717 [Obba rivulosa]
MAEQNRVWPLEIIRHPSEWTSRNGEHLWIKCCSNADPLPCAEPMTVPQRKKLGQLASEQEMELDFLSLPEPADGELGITKGEASVLITMLIHGQLSAAQSYVASIGNKPVETGVPKSLRTGQPTSTQMAVLKAAQKHGVLIPDDALSSAGLAYLVIRSVLSDGTFEAYEDEQQPWRSNGEHEDSEYDSDNSEGWEEPAPQSDDSDDETQDSAESDHGDRLAFRDRHIHHYAGIYEDLEEYEDESDGNDADVESDDGSDESYDDND